MDCICSSASVGALDIAICRENRYLFRLCTNTACKHREFSVIHAAGRVAVRYNRVFVPLLFFQLTAPSRIG